MELHITGDPAADQLLTDDAFALLTADPKLSKPEHHSLRDTVIAKRRAVELVTAA